LEWESRVHWISEPEAARPPFSPEAERGVLGCCLLNPAKIPAILNFLPAGQCALFKEEMLEIGAPLQNPLLLRAIGRGRLELDELP